MHSLIIATDLVQRTVLDSYLTPYGRVEVVSAVDEAVAACEVACMTLEPYDLLVVDLDGPEDPNLAVFDRLAESTASMPTTPALADHPGMRVLVAVSVARSTAVLPLLAGRFDAYVTRPVLRFDLTRALQSVGLLR